MIQKNARRLRGGNFSSFLRSYSLFRCLAVFRAQSNFQKNPDTSGRGLTLCHYVIKPIGAGQLLVYCYNGREALLKRGGRKTTSENTDTLNNVLSFSYINLLTYNPPVELNILTRT